MKFRRIQEESGKRQKIALFMTIVLHIFNNSLNLKGLRRIL